MTNNKAITRLKKGKLQFCLFLIFICFFAFTFYANLISECVYDFAIAHVNTENKNLALYKYKVYGTENRFNEKALAFAENEVQFLKSKGEFAVVKIRGEYKEERRKDYVFISDESVPDLNIEIYIAQNIDIGNNSLPTRTIVVLLEDLLTKVIIVVYAIILLILLYKITRYFVTLTKDSRAVIFISAEKRLGKTLNK